MKKNILVVLLLVFFFGGDTFGQGNPGYMGKKFGFGYRFHFMPGYGNQPSANQSYETDIYGDPIAKKFKINTYHQGFFEFVISRNKTLIFEGLFSKSQFRPVSSDSFEYEYELQYKNAQDWGQMTSYGGRVGLRWYRKHLAPLSSFVGVNTGWQITSVEDMSFSRDELGQISVGGGKKGNLMVGIELGTNTIIKDLIIITFSFESNLAVGLLAGAFFGINNNDSPLLDDAVWRMQYEQIASFGIGIGILP